MAADPEPTNPDSEDGERKASDVGGGQSDEPTEASPEEAAASPEGDRDDDGKASSAADDDDEDRDDDARDAEDDDAEDEGDDAEDAAQAKDKKSAKAPRSGKPLTAGQRLAAAKAAKAAKKADDRGRAPVVPARYTKRAETMMEWVKRNARAVGTAAAVIVVGLGGAYAYSQSQASKAADAARALEHATEIANAEIRDADSLTVGEDETQLTFPTVNARAQKALEAFQKVVHDHGDTGAALWARLGEARALFDLQRYADARHAYETALTDGHDDPAVTWRAIEGIGFTFEGEQKWHEAQQRYQELAHLDEGAYRDIAEYHVARMYLELNDKVRAKETLKTLVERMRAADTDDTTPRYPFILVQAEMRLAELDSSLVPRGSASRGGGGPPGIGVGPGGPGGAGGGPGGGQQLTQEQINQLIQQLQSKAGSKAPPPGGH